MEGKLEKSKYNEWWVRFNGGGSLQMIDESIDTSSFKVGAIINFELQLASNPELTKNSANKYRAFPIDMNYRITFLSGVNDNETQFEVHDVKNIAYDKDMVIFFGMDDKPKFILKQPKYFISKI